MTYEKTLNYLYSRLAVYQLSGGSAYKPGLANTIQLLDNLQNPQKNYPTIHLAGTNGKGSVSHSLASVLQSAGYKVGLYTSPHLVDFGERIRINGEMIEKQYVVDFVAKHQNLFDSVNPSFFEATMAMAFDYFSEQKVDVAVVEAGLGGRLDSTNILNPILSIITNISFDHTDFLGESLEKIAIEKAGIIKPNTPVIIGESSHESKKVFKKRAEELAAPIIFADEKLSILSSSLKSGKKEFEISDNRKFTLDLRGDYQQKNLLTCLAALAELQKQGFSISEEETKEGLSNVTKQTGLQGRWQCLGELPRIVADTGHNTAGMTWIVNQLKKESYKKLRILIGMVNDKDSSGILSLLPTEAVYYFTQANIPRALPAEKLKQEAEKFGLKGENYSSVTTALEQAVKEAEKEDFIFIGGSNFIVGEAMAVLN